MKKQVLSLNISIASKQEFIRKVLDFAHRSISSYVCFANVHMTIEAKWDFNFAKVVNGADFTVPDGMPLVKSLKILYGIKQERIAGMDLLTDFLIEAENQNLSILFYGGTREMLEKTKEYVSKYYPRIERHFYYSPPFRALTEEEEQRDVAFINESKAHLVFVALGCPKQEKWMASMKGRIDACMLGIGGALPVMIGMQKRAPYWIQKLCLEWLYRMVQEPRRLFKRYLITNSIFVFLLVKQIFQRG